jgi:hypothetical protein
MNDPTILQLIVSGSAVTVLGLFTLWAAQGRVRYEKPVLEQYALYEKQIADLHAEREQERKEHAAEIARCEVRNEQLWQDLREAVQVARKGFEVTERAAAVTETAVTATIAKGKP